MHQRRRSLALESPSRQLLKSVALEICDDDEYEKQLFDEQGDEFNPSYQSLKKRMEEQNVFMKDSSIKKTSLPKDSLGHWPLQGGIRETDVDM